MKSVRERTIKKASITVKPSAVEEMLSVDEWQIQGIKTALHEADSCNLIAHEEIKLEWETRRARHSS